MAETRHLLWLPLGSDLLASVSRHYRAVAGIGRSEGQLISLRVKPATLPAPGRARKGNRRQNRLTRDGWTIFGGSTGPDAVTAMAARAEIIVIPPPDGPMSDSGDIICRAGHKKARWVGAAPHRIGIGVCGKHWRCRLPVRAKPLCRAYERPRLFVSNSYASARIFRTRPFASHTESMHMSLLHTYHSDLSGSRGLRRSSRLSGAGVIRKISSAFKAMHRAIIAAKLHRLRNELMLRRYVSENPGFDRPIDVSRFPQRPTVLGEKWDN